jgi:type IV pilus assembly protein PilO
MAVLDSLVNLPRAQKVVIGAVAVALVGGLGSYFLVAPRLAERDTLKQRSDALRAELAKARFDEASLRGYRVQAAALRKRLEAARERLPSEREIPALYRQITSLAQQAGLGVSLFAPKPSEEKDVLYEIPISLTTEGNYHQLGAFFDRLARLPRAVTLSDFKLAAMDRPGATVRSELTLETYVFRPEGAPPPAKPSAPGPPPAPRPAAAPAAPAPPPRAVPAPGGTAPGVPVAGAAVPPPPPKELEQAPPLPPIVYEPRQRRDPFRPLVEVAGRKKGLTVESAKLVGIVEGRGQRLALVETHDGLGYVLRTGDVLGDGRVTEIASDRVSFSVDGTRPGQPGTTVTLRLRTQTHEREMAR